MKKKKYILLSFIILFGLLLFSTGKSSAAPNSNPIFATIEYVQEMFQRNQTDLEFLKRLARLQQTEIDELSERVEYLESLHTPAPTFALPFYVISDNTWYSSQEENDNWFLPEFNDSGWTNSFAPSYGTCVESPINNYINENGALPMWVTDPVEHGSAYFRKHVELLDGVSGSIRAVLDDTGDIYVNGNLVLSDTINSGNDLTAGDVTPYLVTGENVVAIRVSDTAGICQDIQFELKIY